MLNLSKQNLSALAEDGYEFELTHPDTGEGMGGFIKVRGERSKTVQAFLRKHANEQLRQEQGNRAKGKKEIQLLEDFEEFANESAAVRVISWRNIADESGEIKFSKEAAIEVFQEHSWIRDQVLEASRDGEKFRPE